jgi:hypothetical protein
VEGWGYPFLNQGKKKIGTNDIKLRILSFFGLMRRESAQKSLKQPNWIYFGHFLISLRIFLGFLKKLFLAIFGDFFSK